MKYILVLFVLFSCGQNKDYSLVAVDNIQFLFERFADDQNASKKISNAYLLDNSFLTQNNFNKIRDSISQHLITEKRFFQILVSKGNLFSELRGNVLIINDLPKSKAFVYKFSKFILMDESLKFAWDTLSSVKKLYVINPKNGLLFSSKNASEKCKSPLNCSLTFNLSEIEMQQLSNFKALTIGKEIILLSNNEFIAGAEQISQNKNQLIIQR